MADHYDVIIVGSGAGGGTLAHRLAPSGKRVLILERGDWLPREAENWDADAVFVHNRYVSTDRWFDADGKALVWDGCRLIALDPAVAFAFNGAFSSQALDSRMYRCPWHRVVIEGEVPLGSSVAIETFTSEAEKSLQEVDRLPDARWRRAATHADPGVREWDTLIRSDVGRYLWLRLRLESSGETAPLRARYIPARSKSR